MLRPLLAEIIGGDPETEVVKWMPLVKL